MQGEIAMVPIAAITVLNPRARSKRIFDELVTSIANLGLKRPITVSQRDDLPDTTWYAGRGGWKPSWH